MKRALLIVATALALGPTAAGATAPATSTAAASARGGDDLRISYVVVVIDGKPAEIRKFRFRRFTATCDQGTLDLRGRFPRMNINEKRKFSGVIRKAQAKVAVRGEVSRSGKRANGSIRAQGDFQTDAGRFTNCDTGRVPWKGATAP